MYVIFELLSFDRKREKKNRQRITYAFAKNND